MAEHKASTVVDAPVAQVYALFSHFNDFPKFMSYVKEVTYKDMNTSHWVANVAGDHAWDAVNEGWLPNKQIGWRSTSGLENSGVVTFEELGVDSTRVTAHISYDPPAGVLGDAAEKLGVGAHFEHRLQEDLDHFAKMVADAPAGALDPQSSSYLFREGSMAEKGKLTPAQAAS